MIAPAPSPEVTSIDPDNERHTTAAILDQLAPATGDRRFAHAAGILRGRPAGRRPIPDGASVAEAQ